MRVVIQRVSRASVTVEGTPKGQIAQGLVILVGIEDRDTEEDVRWLSDKITGLRIFADEDGKMNKSVLDINGGLLVISQFTLHASTKKGKRPSFIKAARPETAIPLYERFLAELGTLSSTPIESGEFGADMQVSLTNDGPVTITIDSQAKE